MNELKAEQEDYLLESGMERYKKWKKDLEREEEKYRDEGFVMNNWRAMEIAQEVLKARRRKKENEELAKQMLEKERIA